MSDLYTAERLSQTCQDTQVALDRYEERINALCDELVQAFNKMIDTL